MFRIGLAISTAGHGALQRFGPSNIIVRKVRTRRGMKYGLLAILLAVPYLLIAATYTGLIDQGWSGWLYVIAAICIWDAFKMLVLGPASLIWLARSRHQEDTARTRALCALARGESVADAAGEVQHPAASTTDLLSQHRRSPTYSGRTSERP